MALACPAVVVHVLITGCGIATEGAAAISMSGDNTLSVAELDRLSPYTEDGPDYRSSLSSS